MPTVGDPVEISAGLWGVAVSPGHADELLAALDPTVPHVLIECGDPSLGWHDALVTIGKEEQPRLRRVRSLSFDLLTSPSEAMALGGLLRAEHDGQLKAVQLVREPSAHFRLPPAGRGLAQAMTGLGVHLRIELPHDSEVAAVHATHRSVLAAFVERLPS